jgi:transcriptional regulator with XRE-family HTH domain
MSGSAHYITTYTNRPFGSILEPDEEIVDAMDNVVDTFSRILASRRAVQGVSLRTLSRKIELSTHRQVSPATLSRIFTGKTVPTRIDLNRIMDALDVVDEDDRRRLTTLWARAKSAHARRLATGAPRPSTQVQPVAPAPVEADLVVYGGTVNIDNSDVTAGRSLAVVGGEVNLSRHALQAARQISVYGGTLNITDKPNESGDSPPSEEQSAGLHLRRVR